MFSKIIGTVKYKDCSMISFIGNKNIRNGPKIYICMKWKIVCVKLSDLYKY